MMTDSMASPEKRITPLISRRTLLAGVGAGAALGLLPVTAATRGNATTALPPVAALPPGAPQRSLFAPHEQIFAGYLRILAPMANDIVTDGSALHGWMGGGWWRTPSEPFNARVMEHVATLAWFLANERAWNPYYLDPALDARLGAAVDFYLGLQNPDGSFSEYQANDQSLAATGFGTVALTRALVEMQSAGTAPERLQRMRTAIRAASTWLLDTSRARVWSNPISFANQTAAGVVGASAAAEALGDETLLATARNRVALLGARGQAPGGWFYEAGGFDSGYNWGVELPDLGELHSRIGGADLEEQASAWVEFFQYTTVREPGASGYIRMATPSTRTDSTTPILDTVDESIDRWAFANEFLAAEPRLAAFRPTREQVDAQRAAWAASTDPVPARKKQDTSPRLWMHIPNAPQGPTAAQKAAAIGLLSHQRSQRFTRTRASTVNSLRFVFVRRPRYYAGAMYGQRPTDRTRNGVQLVWHPRMGTVLLGLNKGEPDDSWASVIDGVGNDARNTMTPSFTTNTGSVIEPAALDSVTSDFRVHTTMPGGAITATVTFTDTRVVRAVTATSAARELVPLVLQPDDDLSFVGSAATVTWNTTVSTTATGIRITRKGVTATMSWETPLAVSLTPTSRTFFADGARRQHILRIHHPGTIKCQLAFSA